MSSGAELLHPRVRKGLEEAGIEFEALPCQNDLADTAAFCQAYGYEAADVCNTIIVVIKSDPRRYAACLVRFDTKLDVNHRLAAELQFKRLSFASPEETARISEMEFGGVTLPGLPHEIPILIDHRVMERPRVIIGGGNRTSKVRLVPDQLRKLPGSRAAEIAVPR